MQLKLTKIEGHSPGLGLRAHSAASQPKLGAIGAHTWSADHVVDRPVLGTTALLPCREASWRLP